MILVKNLPQRPCRKLNQHVLQSWSLWSAEAECYKSWHSFLWKVRMLPVKIPIVWIDLKNQPLFNCSFFSYTEVDPAVIAGDGVEMFKNEVTMKINLCAASNDLKPGFRDHHCRHFWTTQTGGFPLRRNVGGKVLSVSVFYFNGNREIANHLVLARWAMQWALTMWFLWWTPPSGKRARHRLGPSRRRLPNILLVLHTCRIYIVDWTKVRHTSQSLSTRLTWQVWWSQSWMVTPREVVLSAL